MREELSRLALLVGEKGLDRLSRSRVAVFGLGGVGGHAAEALARSGIGRLDLFDADVVSPSNLNRQLAALQSTIGKSKAGALAERLADAAPFCAVTPHTVFYGPENADAYPMTAYDFVLDAVDNVTAKLTLLTRCAAANTPIVTCMGTGNKLFPERLRLGLLEKTAVCPLARVMRRECKKRGLKNVMAVWSDEPPLLPKHTLYTENGKSIPGSTAFVPASAGLLMAAYTVRCLTGAETAEL